LFATTRSEDQAHLVVEIAPWGAHRSLAATQFVFGPIEPDFPAEERKMS
jgi:hypothetical protein